MDPENTNVAGNPDPSAGAPESGAPQTDPNISSAEQGASATPVETAQTPDLAAQEANARQQLAVARFHGYLSDLQTKQEALENRIAELTSAGSGAGKPGRTTSNEVSGDAEFDALPDSVRDDPGFKLIQRQQAELTELKKMLGDVTTSIKSNQERQTQLERATQHQQIVASERARVSSWLKNDVAKLPDVASNPAVMETLQIIADKWLEKEFDPAEDRATQESEFIIEMNGHLSRLRKAVVAAPTKRDAALETDANAANALSAGAAGRPVVTEQKNPYDRVKDTALWLKWRNTQRASGAAN